MDSSQKSDPDLDRTSDIVGRHLGGYRIAQEVAAGGMAAVYLGHKSGPGGFSQAVAIKIIHPHMARDPAFVEMFLDEARIASHIHHPNVCRVFDFGSSADTYYLAMEFIMGETWAVTLDMLRNRGEDQSLVASVVAHVIAQACEGLHAAHEARADDGNSLDIVHRDVSPQNLIVGYDGSVRVLDFGIAHATDRLHNTRTGTVKGRYSYMAPEQMRGLPVDRRADVWSLGVMLREGLSGKRLFRRNSDAETILAVTQQPVPPWDTPVAEALMEIADKAVQHEPNERYATAREMGLALMRFVNSRPTPLGIAEVSDCMHRLFENRIAAKRRMLYEAKHEGIPGMSMTSDLDARAQPTVHELAGTPVGKHSVSGVLPVTRSEHSESVTYDGEAVRRLWPKLLAVMVLVVVGGVFIVAREGLQPLLRNATEKVAYVDPVAPPPAVVARPKTAPRAPLDVVQIPRAVAEADHIWKPNELPLAEAEPVQGASEAVNSRASSSRRATSRAARHVATVSTPVQPGFVNIATTNGWADVYFHGRKLGTTPGRFRLPAGSQTVTLRRLGKGIDQRHTVSIEPDKVARLRIDLK